MVNPFTKLVTPTLIWTCSGNGLLNFPPAKCLWTPTTIFWLKSQHMHAYAQTQSVSSDIARINFKIDSINVGNQTLHHATNDSESTSKVDSSADSHEVDTSRLNLFVTPLRISVMQYPTRVLSPFKMHKRKPSSRHAHSNKKYLTRLFAKSLAAGKFRLNTARLSI